jgi:uncharacterized membrane protein
MKMTNKHERKYLVTLVTLMGVLYGCFWKDLPLGLPFAVIGAMGLLLLLVFVRWLAGLD